VASGPNVVEGAQHSCRYPWRNDDRRHRDQARLDQRDRHKLSPGRAAQPQALGPKQAPLGQEQCRDQEAVRREQPELDRRHEHSRACEAERSFGIRENLR
jgi:hypothetical protein